MSLPFFDQIALIFHFAALVISLAGLLLILLLPVSIGEGSR
jgi:hypothetical protein